DHFQENDESFKPETPIYTDELDNFNNSSYFEVSTNSNKSENIEQKVEIGNSDDQTEIKTSREQTEIKPTGEQTDFKNLSDEGIIENFEMKFHDGGSVEVDFEYKGDKSANRYESIPTILPPEVDYVSIEKVNYGWNIEANPEVCKNEKISHTIPELVTENAEINPEKRVVPNFKIASCMTQKSSDEKEVAENVEFNLDKNPIIFKIENHGSITINLFKKVESKDS
ncbi:hypothetical protein DMUE_5979, partial [Dictyocoela muelleri]